MSDIISKFDCLLKDDGPAAITLKQWLKPVSGDIFFPPTYANPKKGDPSVYNIDRFGETVVLGKRFTKFDKAHLFMDETRTEQGREHSVCVIDSIPAQANRIEPAFSKIADGKLVPQILINATIGKEKEAKSVNLLEAGHRIADAVVRFSSLESEIADAIRARAKGDSTSIAELAPTSLLFGMWDSQASGVKIPRLLNSIIRAYDILEYRRSSQYFPALKYADAGVASEEELNRLSTEGMAEVPATFQHGGIEARGGICRDASLNLCTLRDIVAKDSDKIEPLQRYILGLALVAMTYFDGRTLNLRQGCQLVAVPEKPMTRTLMNADGTESVFDITRESAIAYAVEAAAKFGVGPDKNVDFDPEKAKKSLKPKETRPKKGAKAVETPEGQS